MIVMGLDFETSGMDPLVHSVTEVGAAMWDTDLHMPVRLMGYLVYDPAAVWQDGASDCSGVTQELCRRYGKDSESVLRMLATWYGQCDAVCAHNGNSFDRLFWEAWCERLGYGHAKDENKVWIDTMTDTELPPEWSRKLPYLATHYGFTNPFPHRAVFDVLTMLRILDCQNLNRVMELAKSPSILVQALVPFERKDEAKARGYWWEADNRRWVKRMKAVQAESEQQAAGFPVKILRK